MSDWLPDGKLPDVATKHGSFLFLVGTILNQNISGELAWKGVARLSERVSLAPEQLVACPLDELTDKIRQAPSIHPFATAMARAIHAAADRVCEQYDGDARSLWRQTASADHVATRLIQFRQIGQHKADVAVFLLTTVYGELDTAPEGVEHACPSLLAYLN
ncbi:hypothetical protein [Fodinicola acaciae]|uniref:hypothetical protein n=1 Tax=Fodinicola acaciae TaxID=2681555 RepID=UPI0013CF73D7|nr:hypothetical protein [Fodinicola acaciae]